MPRMMLKIARGGLCGSSERSVLPTHEEETPLCCGEPSRGPAPLLLLCGPGLDLLTPSLDAHPSHAPPYPRDVTPGPDAGKTGLANESSTIATPSRTLRLALWPALTAHGGCRSLQTLRRLLFASRSLAQAPAARPPALIASH